MAAADGAGAVMLDRTDALHDCARDPNRGARRIVEHGRDAQLAALLDALEEAIDGVHLTSEDFALFLARGLELLVRGAGPGGVALARGALLLGEANAKARRSAAIGAPGSRFHA